MLQCLQCLVTGGLELTQFVSLQILIIQLANDGFLIGKGTNWGLPSLVTRDLELAQFFVILLFMLGWKFWYF